MSVARARRLDFLTTPASRCTGNRSGCSITYIVCGGQPADVWTGIYLNHDEGAGRNHGAGGHFFPLGFGFTWDRPDTLTFFSDPVDLASLRITPASKTPCQTQIARSPTKISIQCNAFLSWWRCVSKAMLRRTKFMLKPLSAELYLLARGSCPVDVSSLNLAAANAAIVLRRSDWLEVPAITEHPSSIRRSPLSPSCSCIRLCLTQ